MNIKLIKGSYLTRIKTNHIKNAVINSVFTNNKKILHIVEQLRCRIKK